MSKAFDERLAEKQERETAEYRKVLIRTALGRVPLCGCGSSERMWEIVRDILQRSQDITDTWDRERETEKASGAPRPLVRVVGFYDPMGDWPADAVEFAAQVLNESDFLEHGSSVQCAWLTAPGKVVLCFLRKYSCDGEKWPEWATSSIGTELHSLDEAGWREFLSVDRDTFTEETIP